MSSPIRKTASARPAFAVRTIHVLAWLSGVLVPAVILTLLAFLIIRGSGALGLTLFFGDTPPFYAITGRLPVWDGIWPACIGTISLLVLTMVLALVPGIGCGVYLACYASGKVKASLGFCIDLLAGIPSVVMGLFGFLLMLALRRTITPDAEPSMLLAASCLALLVLPVLVSTTRGTLEALPDRLHLTASALGMDTWQALRHVLLPASTRGILGGILLAAGRAAEDTAVIMLTGAIANAGLPAGLTSRFEALPFSIFYRASQYRDAADLQQGFATTLVLLAISVSLLSAAAMLQKKLEKQWQGQGNEHR
ncbi:PstA family ABC transporter permease [Oleidesulfovibrio sp.]|uniref:PstA family ABC transporter permease n=1 Tax=Oleidesulfovibrio sp. TaxID=2909707 RepID=UPI003A86DB22